MYRLYDWLTGMMGDVSAAKKIRNLRESGWFDKSVFSKVTSPELDSMGRQQEFEYVDDKSLYRITQDLRSVAKRPAVAAIKDYLAKAGAFADESRRNPSVAIEAGIDGYRRQGKSEKFIEQRVKGVQSRNTMTDAMKSTITDAIDYARITRIEYRGLFKRTLGELLSQMKARSFRDNTTHHALYYLNLLEEIYTVAMTRIENASLEEACSIMLDLADQIGQQVEATSKLLGIDIATGQPLLKARN